MQNYHLSLYPLVISPETVAYNSFPSYVKPIAQPIEYCYLRIQALYYRFQAYFCYHTNFWTDEQIAQHMISHLKEETFSSCSQRQLRAIQGVCSILGHRPITVQFSMKQINDRIDQFVNAKAIKIQSFYRRHLAQRKFKKQREAARAIQSTVRKFLARKQKQKSAALTLQSIFRGRLARSCRKKLESKKIPTHKLYDQLTRNSKKIGNGYGEYIIFHNTPEQLVLKQELYDRVYPIVSQYNCYPSDDQFRLIQDAIQKIDCSLDIVFIPRTLYELIFIRASIEEEVGKEAVCALQSEQGYKAFEKHWKNNDSTIERVKDYVKDKLKNCWHLCCYTTEIGIEFERTLAFRMNDLVIRKLHPTGFFTGKQIVKFAETELDFFRKHRKEFPNILFSPFETPYGSRGASINFGYDQSDGERLYCYPMGINNNNDAQIIRNAIALECDEIAQNSFILYRGGSLHLDTERSEGSVKNTSFSYGTSLFAGAFVDATATVFYYTIEKRRDTYAIVIPYKEYEKSPFHVPVASVIRQLSSRGEFFHPRSKLPTDTPEEGYVYGISGTKEKPNYLLSSLNAKELAVQLNTYHSKALLLTPAH